VSAELRSWRDPAILAAGGLAMAAGFAQFGVTAALGDVADAFGEASPGQGVAAEVGLTGTTLGIGLAIIRLASLASLPAAGLADRLGRRRLLLGAAGIGLALTVLAGASPSWWWFVAIFALGRPLLSATNAVAGVVAAEETASSDRAKAIALVGAAYAIGTGILTVVRGLIPDTLGFRGVFFLAAIPLLALPWLAGRVREPSRYSERAPAQRPAFGTVGRRLRSRLGIVCTLHLAVGLLTGPVNSYLFVYGEQVVGLTPLAMSVLFVAGGAAGLAGLLTGRWGADRYGRRITAGTAMALGAGAGLLTYAGAAPALVAGFVGTTFAASVFAPAAGSLDAEIFPTSVRATVAGWVTASQVLGAVVGLMAFGVIADATGGFTAPAAVVAIPALVAALLYARLPETKGMELEESAPEPED
jgi:MFS family permease